MSTGNPSVLWWGHFDPDYSRNRILRQLLKNQGWRLVDFTPKLSGFGDIEALLRSLPEVDLVWVPCFRQRDLRAAYRWARRRNIPLVFDPLISAYDKQVFERSKLTEGSRRAKKLLRWERDCFSRADLVLADTLEHADFFASMLQVPQKRLVVIPVGAEEGLFKPAENRTSRTQPPFEILFYGSFLHLQGPEIIIEAARIYQGPPAVWRLIGEGPLLESCRALAEGLANVEFLPWVPYTDLPEIICSADLILGVFGTTPKAGRVIPNKVYQALACAKPLITRRAPAYSCELQANNEQGIVWVEPGDSEGLAAQVSDLLCDVEGLDQMGQSARVSYERYFSTDKIGKTLHNALGHLLSV